MAGTVQDTCLQILAATASDAGVQLTANWLNQRYAEFASRARTHQNRHYGSVYVPAPITSGTVSVTQGSPTAVLTDVPSVANIEGWQIRVATQWYFITNQAEDGVTLTLDSNYSEDTNSAAGYTLVMRFIPAVDPNTRWISSVLHQRRRKRLTYKPYEQFNSMYPGRTLVGSFPWCWTEASRYIETLDVSVALTLGGPSQKLFEVYPPSNQPETYTYVYWTLPQTFAVTDSLPPELDEYVLREGVLIDVFRYKSEQWAAKGDVNMAGFYANKEARQMTIWEKKIQEAMITDSLYHREVPIEITLFEDSGEYGGITNAHDWIISGWNQ